MAVDRHGYVEMIQALLPRGPAWPRSPDATLTRLVDALASGAADLDARAEDLLGEIDPRSTTELITEWERVLGLPDPCTPLSATLPARRAAVVHRLVSRTDLTPASIVATAASLGYAATVREHDQAAAEAIAGLDTSAGRWRYVWWLDVAAPASVQYHDVGGGVDEALAWWGATEMECRIREMAPAHTHLVFVYL